MCRVMIPGGSPTSSVPSMSKLMSFATPMPPLPNLHDYRDGVNIRMAQQVFVAVEGQRYAKCSGCLLSRFGVRRTHSDEFVVRQMGQGWEVGPCAPAVVRICPNN